MLPPLIQVLKNPAIQGGERRVRRSPEQPQKDTQRSVDAAEQRIVPLHDFRVVG